MISLDWPPLPFAEWESTCDTLHMWTQIVGKTRAALTPLENHWWSVTLYVTPVGLRTGTIPFATEAFEVAFDFIHHQLLIETSRGRQLAIALEPRSVADFYGEYMTCLKALGIDVKIHTTPDEFDDKTPFEQDRHHASYDRKYVSTFHRILLNADRIFHDFRSRFVGKCSPVQFFWGSFDLAVTRFSGHPAALPPNADVITREAYSHEAISCGFWPGDRRYPQPAFYSYTAPAPPGIENEKIRPAPANWDKGMSEFLFKYDDACAAPSPESAILEFSQSTYEAGAKLAHWDRQFLERAAAQPSL